LDMRAAELLLAIAAQALGAAEREELVVRNDRFLGANALAAAADDRHPPAAGGACAAGVVGHEGGAPVCVRAPPGGPGRCAVSSCASMMSEPTSWVGSPPVSSLAFASYRKCLRARCTWPPSWRPRVGYGRPSRESQTAPRTSAFRAVPSSVL